MNGSAVAVAGRFVKVARIRDEPFIDGDIARHPEIFINKLTRCRKRLDIFEFAQSFTEPTPKFDFPWEWDNAAAACTDSFDDWWDNLPQETRKNVRRASKRGLSVKVARLDDEFARGIKAIYDESPVRQGRHFWHFDKTLEAVKRENSTYLERSEFIGAYYGNELVGFMKFVYVDHAAKIMQILSKSVHYDKRPMNALIAKAVEVCQQKGISYLVYSKFTFGNKKQGPLMEFKRRNGFKQMNFPRYYVPLSVKGKLAIRMNLHRDLLSVLPSNAINALLDFRSMFVRFWPRLAKIFFGSR